MAQRKKQHSPGLVMNLTLTPAAVAKEAKLIMLCVSGGVDKTQILGCGGSLVVSSNRTTVSWAKGREIELSSAPSVTHYYKTGWFRRRSL